MKRTFTIYVRPVARVAGCATKRAEEACGLFGFHAFTRCPACRVIPDGCEFWGANGHLQGRCDLDGDLARHVAFYAARGDTVLGGGVIHYQGPWRDEVGPPYGIPATEG